MGQLLGGARGQQAAGQAGRTAVGVGGSGSRDVETQPEAHRAMRSDHQHVTCKC
jgi:hypothetical protein